MTGNSQACVLLRNRLRPQCSQWEDVMSGKLGGVKKEMQLMQEKHTENKSTRIVHNSVHS